MLVVFLACIQPLMDHEFHTEFVMSSMLEIMMCWWVSVWVSVQYSVTKWASSDLI